MGFVPSPPRRPSVLVVEDDPELRALYRTALAMAGYTVTSAEDGIEALRRIDANPPDIIVLDLGLPRLGGRDVQRELAAHAETASIPILLVTADPTGIPRADFACILQKPVDLDELVVAVERCLRESR